MIEYNALPMKGIRYGTLPIQSVYKGDVKIWPLLGRYIINPGKCIECGACVPECDFDAIEYFTSYVINQDKCTGCGKCSPVCGVGAIEII